MVIELNDEMRALIARSPVLVQNEAAMQALGQELAMQLPRGSLVTLSGELGSGKSVLVRSVIHACGFEGRVKSPTYTLIETYDCQRQALCANVYGTHDADASEVSELFIAHLDLYRLTDPDELEYIGFDDVLASHDIVFIEWPEQGGDTLPLATLHVLIEYDDSTVRKVSFSDPAADV